MMLLMGSFFPFPPKDQSRRALGSVPWDIGLQGMKVEDEPMRQTRDLRDVLFFLVVTESSKVLELECVTGLRKRNEGWGKLNGGRKQGQEDEKGLLAQKTEAKMGILEYEGGRMGGEIWIKERVETF